MDKGPHELRRDYWRQIIRECNARERGITKLAWFQEHNINSKSYYYWQEQSSMVLGDLVASLSAIYASSAPQT